MNKEFKKAISLIFRDVDNVLVVKRSLKKDIFPGFWSLPSMYIKEGESSVDIANKIGKEKLGLSEVKIQMNPCGVSPVVDRGDYLFEMKNFNVTGYKGEISLNENVYTEHRWATPEELKKLIDTENNGEMGECTRTFLKIEELI